jgi:hypothetical protein
MLGPALLTTWSRTQASVSLSSAESEYYGLVSGASEGLFVRSLLRELGLELRVVLGTDSSAAKAATERAGVSKMKHIEIKYHFLKDLVARKEVYLMKLRGTENCADVMTKHVDLATLDRLMPMLNVERCTAQEASGTAAAGAKKRGSTGVLHKSLVAVVGFTAAGSALAQGECDAHLDAAIQDGGHWGAFAALLVLALVGAITLARLAIEAGRQALGILRAGQARAVAGPEFGAGAASADAGKSGPAGEAPVAVADTAGVGQQQQPGGMDGSQATCMTRAGCTTAAHVAHVGVAAATAATTASRAAAAAAATAAAAPSTHMTGSARQAGVRSVSVQSQDTYSWYKSRPRFEPLAERMHGAWPECVERPSRPACPVCGAEGMVLCRNAADGRHFWGCPNFVQGTCRGTRRIEP